VDNAAGTRLALEHLYELGHRRLAFIKGPTILVDSVQRWQGLQTFAKEVGLQLDPQLIVEIQGRNSTFTEAYNLTEGLLRQRSEFTALVAFDDLSACAGIRALTKAGLQVPKDVSVVGFDNIPSAAFYNPPLTTVHQQLELQGSLGAEIVENFIRAAREKRSIPPQHRRVQPKLIVRDSTCPAQRSGRNS
jgi:DNA-binding LacI/PurR family transcriptional regulator